MDGLGSFDIPVRDCTERIGLIESGFFDDSSEKELPLLLFVFVFLIPFIFKLSWFTELECT